MKKPLITGSHSKYGTHISFLDIMMNIILAFVVMFLLAFLQINERILKTPQVESKAELLLILTWPDYNNDDLDLWVQLPGNRTVSFVNKDVAFVHLERDDRGLMGDIIEEPGQPKKFIRLNKEVVTFRALVPGTYDVNVHYYNVNEGAMFYQPGVEPVMAPFKAKVTLAKINPSYEEVAVVELEMEHTGDEKTAFSFTITNDLKIDDISHKPIKFVTKSPYGPGGLGHDDPEGH